MFKAAVRAASVHRHAEQHTCGAILSIVPFSSEFPDKNLNRILFLHAIPEGGAQKGRRARRSPFPHPYNPHSAGPEGSF